MFTMMNEARLKIGVQGLGVSEGAYQQALDYARERVQGGVPIIEHADVKRMLLTMKTSIEAMRALWAGPHAEFHGEFVDFDPCTCSPRPVNGNIPVLVGGDTDAAISRSRRR